MSTKRHIDKEKKTIIIEFSNGSTFGPVELNETTDALMRMIGVLEGRIKTLEDKSN